MRPLGMKHAPPPESFTLGRQKVSAIYHRLAKELKGQTHIRSHTRAHTHTVSLSTLEVPSFSPKSIRSARGRTSVTGGVNPRARRHL